MDLRTLTHTDKAQKRLPYKPEIRSFVRFETWSSAPDQALMRAYRAHSSVRGMRCEKTRYSRVAPWARKWSKSADCVTGVFPGLWLHSKPDVQSGLVGYRLSRLCLRDSDLCASVAECLGIPPPLQWTRIPASGNLYLPAAMMHFRACCPGAYSVPFSNLVYVWADPYGLTSWFCP